MGDETTDRPADDPGDPTFPTTEVALIAALGSMVAAFEEIARALIERVPNDEGGAGDLDALFKQALREAKAFATYPASEMDEAAGVAFTVAVVEGALRRWRK